MIFQLGIENNNDDRTIAWALDHPGCFAYGQDSDEAQKNFLQAVREYAAWIAQHGESWLNDEIEIIVEETFDVYFINQAFERVERGRDTYMVESFFVHDWKPLVPHEIEHALKLLAWSRADLMSVVQSLSLEKREQTYRSERWSALRRALWHERDHTEHIRKLL
jgi:hypothetical protein